jgi:hypothetical protein
MRKSIKEQLESKLSEIELDYIVEVEEESIYDGIEQDGIVYAPGIWIRREYSITLEHIEYLYNIYDIRRIEYSQGLYYYSIEDISAVREVFTKEFGPGPYVYDNGEVLK